MGEVGVGVKGRARRRVSRRNLGLRSVVSAYFFDRDKTSCFYTLSLPPLSFDFLVNLSYKLKLKPKR